MAISRITWIWLLLLALTLLTYGLGKAGLSGPEVMLTILAAAFLKGHWIIEDFMELRGAAFLWRAMTHFWLLLVSGMILLAYLIAI